ncbi:MAG: hypothetical protein E6X17_05035 [Sporomusaceae bacterium]|nr:hypothetical protein [Sporomusaceae bacterium]
MGISKYNAEGYYDPTAYEGIRRAEVDTGKLKIVYPTGYMELNLEGFFPCPLDKARKVFSLVYRYSPEPDKDRLLAFLRRLEKRYFAQMQEYASEAATYPAKSDKWREYTAKFKEAMRLRQRVAKNIELFIQGGTANEN